MYRNMMIDRENQCVIIRWESSFYLSEISSLTLYCDNNQSVVDVERVCHWSGYDRNVYIAEGESTGESERKDRHSFDYTDEGVKSNDWLVSNEQNRLNKSNSFRNCSLVKSDVTCHRFKVQTFWEMSKIITTHTRYVVNHWKIAILTFIYKKIPKSFTCI